jgi:sialate O-acetylesterase
VTDIKPIDDAAREKIKDPVAGKWGACTPASAPKFTAVGYFFGRDLQQNLKVPVGLIHTSWGGTRAEAWTPNDWLKKDADLAKTLTDYEASVKSYPERVAAFEKQLAKFKTDQAAAKAAGKEFKQQAPRGPAAPGNDPNAPSVLYNGMIAPILPYTIKGSIWYQGESNAGKAFQYRTLLPLMIDSWRAAWGDNTDKFLIVQLANFQQPSKTPPDNDAWAELREAQTMTANLPNNGQALAIDLADKQNPGDIHPKNKQDVGNRLARVALGKYYGKADVAYAGPTYESHKVEGNKVLITLKHAEGLTARDAADGNVKGFQICGEDKKWVWADARVEGGSVGVWSEAVQKPVAVRYAWSVNPVTNLYNGAGLPAQPFRTDDWPGMTAPKK